jgi:hypothetical protein
MLLVRLLVTLGVALLLLAPISKSAAPAEASAVINRRRMLFILFCSSLQEQ